MERRVLQFVANSESKGGYNVPKATNCRTQEAAEKYFDYLQRNSQATNVTYRGKILHFLGVAAPQNLEHLTVEHIEMYISGLFKAGLKNTSVNVYLAALRSFCEFLQHIYGYHNPMPLIKRLKNEEPEKRILTPAEYEQILRCNSGIDRDVVVFLTHTGLRRAEFLALKATDFEGEFLRIRHGKGDKCRLVPLNATARSIIESYLDHDSNTIKLIKSRCPNWLLRLCRRTARKAKIEPFSPHALRHYFATSMFDKGVPIKIISKALGHSSILTTERYIHFSERRLAGSTDCLD